MTRDRMWYVAYGSNLAAARFSAYLAGGRPEGARRTYSGCRDTTPPVRDEPVELPGEVVFAGQSTVWTGGMAFYDAQGRRTVAARAYLLSAQQANDVVAQETRHPLGAELGLTALAQSSSATVREGGYDSVVRLQDIDGLPAVTITAVRPLRPVAPSEAYLRWVCAGLREAHGWSAEQVGRYLGRCRGVEGRWPVDALVDLAGSD